MTDDRQPDTDMPSCPGELVVDLDRLNRADRAVHERRRRSPVYRDVDVSDLLVDASQRHVRLRLELCCESSPAPLSVVSCARRVLDVALVALGPPVSRRLDVHMCHLAGQLGVQVTALDRRSFTRLLATDHGRQALAELSVWFSAFSPLFSLEPLGRDRANVAAVLPFDCGAPWALPACSRLQFGTA